MRTPIYVRPLTDAERETLEAGLHASDRLGGCDLLPGGGRLGPAGHDIAAAAVDLADAAGVPLEKVELIVSDTATAENSGSVSASRCGSTAALSGSPSSRCSTTRCTTP